MKTLSAAGVASIVGGLLFYFACLNYLEPTQAGISRNLMTGEVKLQGPGWHLTPPVVAVARVDVRPVRVCLTSASRGFNCRLVQFEPSSYQQFVATQGFYYYWWSNRVSFNWGYSEEYRGMKDLMRGYAFSANKYPFLKLIREYGSAE